MLWLCAHYPRLPLDALTASAEKAVSGASVGAGARADGGETPTAVIVTRGSRRTLHTLNAAAEARELHPGQGLPSALSRVPELITHERQQDLECGALEGEALWAYRWGAPVVLDATRYALWVEIGHSLSLFGGWPALARALIDEPCAMDRRLGVAPTQAAALLLAQASKSREKPRKAVHRLADLTPALAPLPLHRLPLSPDALELLQSAGLRRIGEVLALPRTDLATRLGEAQQRALDQLLGHTPEVWQAWQPPTVYRRRFDFAEPIETTQALLFPLRGLIADCLAWLRARQLAVQHFEILLRDTRRRLVRQPLGLLAPTQDEARLLLVLREQLDRLRVEDPITEVTLVVERFEPLDPDQDGLFGEGSRAKDHRQRLALTERLIARLGATAVRSVAMGTDARPEAATLIQTGIGSGGGRGSEATPAEPPPHPRHPPRPLWLLKTPKPIAAPLLRSTAERLELGWWQGDAPPRDYHLAEDAQQRLCWVYRHPDDPEQWWLHGLWQ